MSAAGGESAFILIVKNSIIVYLLKGLPARRGKFSEVINDHSGSV